MKVTSSPLLAVMSQPLEAAAAAIQALGGGQAAKLQIQGKN
jgi:hypothetical protein